LFAVPAVAEQVELSTHELLVKFREAVGEWTVAEIHFFLGGVGKAS
jgi:hypothetical protein